ncbi:hypothetical protein MMC13_005650 [Lambiella insularis]|nr:hypothetical protein [Lambiella insularis]
MRQRRSKSSSSTPSTDPMDDYYSLLLSQPLYTTAPAVRTSPMSQKPSERTKDATMAKARVVFGSRLAGPARRREIESKSSLISGVLVPPRPQQPDNCCMSGCVNCVWDLYRDDMEDWASKSREARMKQAISNQNEVSGSMDDDGGGSETSWTSEKGQDLFADVPIGIREFMKTEKVLKDRRKGRMTVGG